MSGRKQHYIPQFLLRAFGRERKGGLFQVRVHFPDKTFVTATSGVAAEREFYSAISTDSGTLDDHITRAEAEYAVLHQRSVTDPPDRNVVARLLAHLTVRGDHTRQSASHVGSSAMDMLDRHFEDPASFKRAIGLDGAAPRGHFKAAIDKKYNELKSEGGRIRVSRYDFQRLAHRLANERFEELFRSTLIDTRIVAASMKREMSDTVADAQRNALYKEMEPQKRVDCYSDLHWKAFDRELHSFLLPDCIALARRSTGEVTSSFYVGNDELNMLWFPVSSKRLLVGSKKDDGNETILSDFNCRAAQASWSLFVSHPSMADPGVNEYIGAGIKSFIAHMLETVAAKSAGKV